MFTGMVILALALLTTTSLVVQVHQMQHSLSALGRYVEPSKLSRNGFDGHNIASNFTLNSKAILWASVGLAMADA